MKEQPAGGLPDAVPLAPFPCFGVEPFEGERFEVQQNALHEQLHGAMCRDETRGACARGLVRIDQVVAVERLAVFHAQPVDQIPEQRVALARAQLVLDRREHRQPRIGGKGQGEGLSDGLCFGEAKLLDGPGVRLLRAYAFAANQIEHASQVDVRALVDERGGHVEGESVGAGQIGHIGRWPAGPGADLRQEVVGHERRRLALGCRGGLEQCEERLLEREGRGLESRRLGEPGPALEAVPRGHRHWQRGNVGPAHCRTAFEHEGQKAEIEVQPVPRDTELVEPADGDRAIFVDRGERRGIRVGGHDQVSQQLLSEAIPPREEQRVEGCGIDVERGPERLRHERLQLVADPLVVGGEDAREARARCREPGVHVVLARRERTDGGGLVRQEVGQLLDRQLADLDAEQEITKPA